MQGKSIVNREPDLRTAEQLVADVSALITPPSVCVKMSELVHSSSASADEIGKVVALDPNLAARLLRIVNSSYFGLSSPVNTISRAVTILGTRDLYNLVLAIASVRSFSKMDAGLVRMEVFWQHSVFCALLARELGRHYRMPNAERLFVAGLLHEVGTSVIYSQLPQFEQQMRVAVQAGEAALHNAEIEHFGYSHASIGSLVLEQWQLPIEILNAVRYHHDPGAARSGQVEASLVHIADVLANGSQIGALCPNPTTALQFDEAVWDVLGEGPESLDAPLVLDKASDAFSDCMHNLMPAKSRHRCP